MCVTAPATSVKARDSVSDWVVCHRGWPWRKARWRRDRRGGVELCEQERESIFIACECALVEAVVSQIGGNDKALMRVMRAVEFSAAKEMTTERNPLLAMCISDCSCWAVCQSSSPFLVRCRSFCGRAAFGWPPVCSPSPPAQSRSTRVHSLLDCFAVRPLLPCLAISLPLPIVRPSLMRVPGCIGVAGWQCSSGRGGVVLSRRASSPVSPSV